MRRFVLIVFSCIALSSLSHAEEIQPLRLKLPTANIGLIEGKPETFYMYVNRTLNGVASRPWTGGKWGFTRTLRQTNEGLIATKFHEGIDISPVRRDSANRPLDIVHSIAEGEVVYTNATPGRSNYGNYVVIKHDWGYGPFYSLYAHLATVNCKVGQQVRAEAPLGRMGYTGVGLNVTRAHLHLELGIMIHPEFNDWHSHHYPGGKNWHGQHNGLNINGLDIATLFLANHKNNNLTIPQFLKNTPTDYKVIIPRNKELAICKFYPWLKKGDHSKSSPSWKISFTNSAFPLSVEPSQTRVSKPTVSFVTEANYNHSYRSKGLLSGSGSTATLSSAGRRYMTLIAGTFNRQGNE